MTNINNYFSIKQENLKKKYPSGKSDFSPLLRYGQLMGMTVMIP